MQMQAETYFWKKKEFVSFLLSVLVFFIHFYFASESADGSFISLLNHKTSYFFSRSITQFAVPMFFMLSAIAFFREYDNSKYLRKIKSRIFTLIIPYLLWNTVWMIWEILCSYSFLSRFSASTEAVPLTFTNLLKGVFFYGYNGPFWFMFNLIIFSLAAPVVFLIIKNKYVAITSIVVLSVLTLFGIHIPISFFYDPNSIIFYLIGATIGYHYFDFICKKSTKKTQIISGAFLLAYILVKTIVPQRLHVENYLAKAVVLSLCALALWNITDAFASKLKSRPLYRRSFAVYAMHLNLALIVLKVINIVLPQRQWLEIPKFAIMVCTTLIIINYLCALLEKFAPKIYGLFMGKGIKRT